jgi:hypothetical protein
MASIRVVSGLRAPLRSVSCSRVSIRSVQNTLKFTSISHSSVRSTSKPQVSKVILSSTIKIQQSKENRLDIECRVF